MKWDKCLWDSEKMWHCLIREDCSTCPFYKELLEKRKILQPIIKKTKIKHKTIKTLKTNF